MEERSNIAMAIEALEDEMDGVKHYTEMLENVTCPELRKIIVENLNSEKKHAGALLSWINAAAHKVLS